jgi:3-phenylpropionate/trans-cinnamate dioxygenase ferredoxin subunit
MGTLIQAGTVGELDDGSMKEISAEGRAILLARVGDRYYATDNRCPHMGGRLSQGKLEGTVVTCPRHGSQFDLRDGKVVRWLKGGVSSIAGKLLKSPRPIATYPVKLDGDKIMLEI